MSKPILVFAAALLVGSIAQPPSLPAAGLSSASPPLSSDHLTSVGRLTQTVAGDIVQLRFESSSGRSMTMIINKRTLSMDIEGFHGWTQANRFVISYGGQVAHGAAAAEALESAGYVVRSWREDTGLGPVLAEFQMALHESLIAQATRRIHPLMMTSCGFSLFLYEAAWANFLGTYTFASGVAVLAAGQNMCDSCGGCECQTVTGFEEC